MLFSVGMDKCLIIKSKRKSNECLCHLRVRAAVNYRERSVTITLQDTEIDGGV